MVQHNEEARVKQASFAGSESSPTGFKGPFLPSCAVMGRSNVGKSSLINLLFNSALAKTSTTPGKTKLINRFLVNNSWYLVDLPGYGFARVGKDEKKKIQHLIEAYLVSDSYLRCVLLLLDSRHEVMEIDKACMAYLDGCGLPYAIVATKMDKLASPYRAAFNAEVVGGGFRQLIHTSSKNKIGGAEVLGYIQQALFETPLVV